MERLDLWFQSVSTPPNTSESQSLRPATAWHLPPPRQPLPNANERGTNVKDGMIIGRSWDKSRDLMEKHGT